METPACEGKNMQSRQGGASDTSPENCIILADAPKVWRGNPPAMFRFPGVEERFQALEVPNFGLPAQLQTPPQH